MKRETIERHLHNNANATSPGKAVAESIFELLERERERLTEELAELDAKWGTKGGAVPGFTDDCGDFFEFVRLASGEWAAVHVDQYGDGVAYSQREHGPTADALRAFIKGLGQWRSFR